MIVQMTSDESDSLDSAHCAPYLMAWRRVGWTAGGKEATGDFRALTRLSSTKRRSFRKLHLWIVRLLCMAWRWKL